MYQSKLAKPEVKPHYFWNKKLKMWNYTAKDTMNVIRELVRVETCDHLDQVYNPLRSGK